MRKVDKTSFDAARRTQGGVSAADGMGESDLDSQHILEMILNTVLRVIRGLVLRLLLADRRSLIYRAETGRSPNLSHLDAKRRRRINSIRIFIFQYKFVASWLES